MLAWIRTVLRWAYVGWIALAVVYSIGKLTQGEEPGRVILGFLGLSLLGLVVWAIARPILWPISRN
jgi:hypothetical protein